MNHLLLKLVLQLAVLLAVGSDALSLAETPEPPSEETPIDVPTYRTAPEQVKSDVTTLLRKYCGACHAVGKMNFLPADTAEENWAAIFESEAPSQKRPWVQVMIEVLSWPNGTPPPFDQPIDRVQKRDWMPKGIKRLNMAQDTFIPSDGSTETPINPRVYILEALSNFSQ